MEIQLLIAITAINLFFTILLFLQRNRRNFDVSQRIDGLEKNLTKIESGLREDFKINREENSNIAKTTTRFARNCACQTRSGFGG